MKADIPDTGKPLLVLVYFVFFSHFQTSHAAEFQWEHGGEQVSVLGSFNEWTDHFLTNW